MPLKIFKPRLNTFFPFSKIKSLSPSLLLSLTAPPSALSFFLSLNSKALQPLLSIAAGAALPNVTNSNETDLCLFGKPQNRISFSLLPTPMTEAFSPLPTPKVTRRFSCLSFSVYFLYFSHLICMFFLFLEITRVNLFMMIDLAS